MSATAVATRPYYVPQPSPYPAALSFSLMLLAIGFGLHVNGFSSGQWIIGAGAVPLLYALFGWFGSVIRESQRGFYRNWEDRSFRLGMISFIVSEVVLFATFFGVLFYERAISIPWLASLDSNFTPWPGFTSAWPTAGPAGKAFEVINPWGIPALNTIILLTSGMTITFAHLGLKRDKRLALSSWLPSQSRLASSSLHCKSMNFTAPIPSSA